MPRMKRNVYPIDTYITRFSRARSARLFSTEKKETLKLFSPLEKFVNSIVHFVSSLPKQYSNAHNRGGKSRKIEIRNARLVLELRNLDDNAEIKSDAEIPGINRIHGTRSVPEAYNYRAQAFNIELATSEGFL